MKNIYDKGDIMDVEENAYDRGRRDALAGIVRCNNCYCFNTYKTYHQPGKPPMAMYEKIGDYRTGNDYCSYGVRMVGDDTADNPLDDLFADSMEKLNGLGVKGSDDE